MYEDKLYKQIGYYTYTDDAPYHVKIFEILVKVFLFSKEVCERDSDKFD